MHRPCRTHSLQGKEPRALVERTPPKDGNIHAREYQLHLPARMNFNANWQIRRVLPNVTNDTPRTECRSQTRTEQRDQTLMDQQIEHCSLNIQCEVQIIG
jgi:hypothetical protein